MSRARLRTRFPVSSNPVASSVQVPFGPDERVRKIKGALSLALLARDKKLRGVIVPEENGREAAVVERFQVYPVSSLCGFARLVGAG